MFNRYPMRSPLKRYAAKAIAARAIDYLSKDEQIEAKKTGSRHSDAMHHAIGKELDWCNGFMFDDIHHYVNELLKRKH